MNEFEKLEEELKELRPLPPSDAFTARLEEALGDAGNVAMRCLPDREDDALSNDFIKSAEKQVFPVRLLIFAGLGSLGLAAVWAAIFYFSSSIVPSGSSEQNDSANLLIAESGPVPEVPGAELREDPNSPLHGISLKELQDVSVMPVSGWIDPQINERFVRKVDEGVFDRPGELPARRVRHYFMDETLWSHPGSDLRILSTTPREEVIFIELETY
jgi:hypothetical protein